MIFKQICYMQGQPKDFCLRTERPPASPQPAAAVVEAWLSDAVVRLPFDQDPGTAERFTELWAKAFKEASMLLIPFHAPASLHRLLPMAEELRMLCALLACNGLQAGRNGLLS